MFRYLKVGFKILICVSLLLSACTIPPSPPQVVGVPQIGVIQAKESTAIGAAPVPPPPDDNGLWPTREEVLKLTCEQRFALWNRFVAKFGPATDAVLDQNDGYGRMIYNSLVVFCLGKYKAKNTDGVWSVEQR